MPKSDRIQIKSLRVALGLASIVLAWLALTMAPNEAWALRDCGATVRGSTDYGVQAKITSCKKAWEVTRKHLSDRDTGKYECKRSPTQARKPGWICDGPGGRRVEISILRVF